MAKASNIPMGLIWEWDESVKLLHTGRNVVVVLCFSPGVMLEMATCRSEP
jgi:hypothetical protein